MNVDQQAKQLLLCELQWLTCDILLDILVP